MGIRAKVDTSAAKTVLKKLGATIEKEVREAVTLSTIDAHTHARRLILSGGSGRQYKKYKPKRVHQASAPGQSPASDTGRLASSIYAEIDAAKLDGTVGSQLAYSAALELGSRKMAARPYLVPSVEYVRPIFRKRVAAALKKARSRAGRR